MKKPLDFMPRVNQKINSLGLSARSVVGILQEDDSYAVSQTPGGSETNYMDGTRLKYLQFQVAGKNKKHETLINEMNGIYQHLERLEQNDLISGNESYKLAQIETKSMPSLVTQTEGGYFIYTANFSAEILIYQEVI